MKSTQTIGVLALQGAFIEHINAFRKIPSVKVKQVKTEKDLAECDSLVLPGGESTAIALAAKRNDLFDKLVDFIKSGKPVWGTCAGLILLSSTVLGAKKGGQATFGGLNIVVQRNAFGGQIDSFVSPLDISFENLLPNAATSDSRPFEGVFIRAPVIESISENVQVICKTRDGKIVAVKEGNILGTAFHPELTQDDRFHRYFVSFHKGKAASSQI